MASLASFAGGIFSDFAHSFKACSSEDSNRIE
jgi:hypothetical protein